MNLTVREAKTIEEKEYVYRLRYDIYISEMNRTQTYADHTKKRIYEPIDDHARLLICFDEEKPVGTLRLNLRKEGVLECEELYDLEKFSPFYPNQVTMSTKLMVLPEYRSSMATSLLTSNAYYINRQENCLFDFIDTNPHLVRLYSQVGYRIYKENISHPEYGDVIPMVFLTDDIEYMKAVHSPFYRLAKRYDNDTKARKHFDTNFSEYSSIRPLFTYSTDEFWEQYGITVEEDKTNTLRFVRGFSKEDWNKLLNQLDLLHYNKGDIIFREGDTSTGLFAILEGQVEVIGTNGKPYALLTKGDTFGEIGLVAKTKRNATIRVREKSKLVMLTTAEFRKIELAAPNLAIKLLENLFGILAERFNDNSRTLQFLRPLLEVIQEKTESMD